MKVVYRWGQANRNRGAGWTFAHLFPRDEATGLDDGHRALCGYDPTARLGTGDQVDFRAAPEDAPRCAKCEVREQAGFCDTCGHSHGQLIAGCPCCESWRSVGLAVPA